MNDPGRRRGPGAVVHALVMVFASSATALVTGLLKNVLAAYYFGTSGAMDAYLLALVLPDMAMHLAYTGAFNFIPLFAAEEERSREDAWRAAGKMVSYWLLLLLCALVLAWLLSPLATSLLAPAYGGQRRAQTIAMTQLLLLMAASCGMGRILGVVLHAERRFFRAGLAEVAFQVGSIGFLIAYHALGVLALAWAQVFGGFLQLLVAAICLMDRRHRLHASFDLKSAPVRRMINLSLPVYLALSGDKINIMVTRAFGSLLPAGAVSALQYAYTPVEGLHRMLASPMALALFPFLSRGFAGSDQRRARSGLGRTVVTAAVAFLPLAATVWLLADPLVVVLFERGSFDVNSTSLTASALRIFAPAIFALALNELVGSSFHARQDTLTPMGAGFARVACNGLLCAALATHLGHRGIALATTVSLYLKLLLLGLSLRGVFAPHEVHRHLHALGRVLLAVGVMFAVVYPFAAFASTRAVVQRWPGPALAGLLGLCMSVYVASLWVFARRQFLLHLGLVRRVLLRYLRRPLASGVRERMKGEERDEVHA